MLLDVAEMGCLVKLPVQECGYRCVVLPGVHKFIVIIVPCRAWWTAKVRGNPGPHWGLGAPRCKGRYKGLEVEVC